MPIYDFLCKTCGAKAEVIRTLSEGDAPPDDQEAYGGPSPNGCKHEWEKQMGLTRPHQRAPGFGSKGNW
jgi:hypothetical protein